MAGVSLNAIIGDNGIVSTAMDARIMSKFSLYDEEIKTNCINDENVYAVKDKMKKYVPSLEEQDLDNFVIVKSRLLYVGTDETELEIANRLGLGGGDNSDSKATITEIQEIIDGVVELKNKFPDGNESENNDTADGFIGTKLLDRQNHLIDGSWNILIDYKNNKETGRYENGYWLEKGKTYIIDGESLTFKNDYVVDYENREFNVLSSERVNWNRNATLGVKDDIALDLDPMSLANGTWKESNEKDEVSGKSFYDFYNNEVNTGIQKVGDVIYDSKNKSLNFNEIEDSPNGYLKLKKDNLDFQNGFTFEFFGSLSENTSKSVMSSNKDSIGFFCKVKDLTDPAFTRAMRFGYNFWGTLCKFYGGSSFAGRGDKLETNSRGEVFLVEDLEFKKDEDFYLTFVYRDYQKEKDNVYYDDCMRSKECDKLELYINGELYGYTYYGKDSYEKGLEYWNNDDSTFRVGVCVWDAEYNYCYLTGNCYCTRLYTSQLSPEDVEKNYDMTLKYRDSFKDE